MLAYNHQVYLRKAVECVMSQEVDFNIELVIGEDFSTDGTRDLAIALQSRFPDRIRLLLSETNIGSHANALRVESACRSKYIAYCEGDDFWHDRTKLAKQVAFMEARPDYSMVHSHCDRFYAGSGKLVQNSLRVRRDLDDANAYEDILVNRRSPLSVTVMARADDVHWIREHCLECTDPRWPMGDTQRWLELSRRGKVGCIHESLATTNVLLESAGQSQDQRKRLRFYLKGRDLKLHYLEKYPVDPDLARAVREKLALILLHQAFDARDAEVAGELYRDYMVNCDKPAWRAKWLLWGCQSPWRRPLIQPLMQAERRWRNAQLRLRRAA